MPKKFVLFLCFVLVFVVGGVVGVSVWKGYSSCKSKFQFINQDLACGNENGFDKSNPITLKNNLTDYINSKKGEGNVSEVSVYFRDLKYGPILGIDENKMFISASLLKLPISLTPFKLSEEDMPGILDRNLLFKLEDENEKVPEQFFKPTQTISVGSVYTVRELIFRSLAYSDNWANEVLKTYLGQISKDEDLTLQTFKELGLIEPASLTANDLSTKSYASIFRILYNASYLSREDSESVLSILSQSEFDQGIVSGVPAGVHVSNKFGERDLGVEKQLHDCGIIYFPENPYLICIMTRGNDYSKLTGVIKDISAMVYKEMSLRSRGE